MENNYLSRDEASEKSSLQYQLRHGKLVGEAQEHAEARLVQFDEIDKARDKAIKDVCQSGSKGSAGCIALVAPAEMALRKYGENVSYSLLYKDLYPQDAKNLENVLQGLNAGGVGRDQAITAIAKASSVSWDTAAKRYDTAMQLQAVTATMAGFYGIKSITSPEKNVKPIAANTSPTPHRVAEKNALAVDEEAAGWSQYDKYRNKTGEWNWPVNNGAVSGSSTQTTIPVGTILDRFGSEKGVYVSPSGVPYPARSLAPGTAAYPSIKYEVLKPILGADKGTVAPAFGEPGSGIQYKLPSNVEKLIAEEYIKRID